MGCYGKKGKAQEIKSKKNDQKEKLLKEYLTKYNVNKSDLTSNELHLLNTLMYKADDNIYTILGCKGLEHGKSNTRFISKSIRVIKKDNENNTMYSIVLEDGNHKTKCMQVSKDELSAILSKHFGVYCTRSEHNNKINSKATLNMQDKSSIEER